ncbi:glycosyltransferase [Sphingomonas oligophenolica]|uniref:Glycosyltransferase n=1 Tax=Sphingomonas oligophenolica TaxID=301154 RepID=A0A502BYN5_9SPHN|nr:glycosyltransferase [Sphingomonas oligophenolica]TPG06017.1 glycosyltransferase [Sphingomonas oligophenolica]
MRILTFLHSFEPGGVERVALRLVARWRDIGIDAPLFMGRTDGALRSELATNLSYASPDQPAIGTAWWETLWMIRMLPRHIRRTAPDALFCAGSTYTIVAIAMKLVLGRACPPILAKISNDLVRADLPAPARAMWKIWLRLQARFIDQWVVMDTAILPDVATHMGNVERTVIPDPAIDRLPPLRSLRVIDRGTRYVAVGRLARQKNHALMLAAYAEVARPDDRLTLIGEGPLRSRLEQQAAGLEISAQVHFAGHVPNAAEAMRDHDVLLLSSRYEGVPAVLIEALAAGLKIVSTDSGPGVRSVLANGGLGTVVVQDDTLAFAAALAAAPTKPVDVTSARKQAQRFTLDAVVTDYVSAITQMVSIARRPIATRPADAVEHAA